MKDNLTFEQKMEVLKFVAQNTTPWWKLHEVLVQTIRILFGNEVQ